MPRAKLVELLKEAADECDIRLYPQEEEEKLREAIVDYLRLPEGCIAIGNSSDEIMDRITRLFLEKDSKAVTFSPHFQRFSV
jgi:histidinol-phosphate/aromatic aminotransferase/cobyric acid decarboxylase-like protein